MSYSSENVIDSFFSVASLAKFKVVRLWGFMDQVYSGSYVFQTFDSNSKKTVIHDDKFSQLDYALWKAKQSGFKVILTLVNNWMAFGGMNAYLNWFGGKYHDEFYTRSDIRK